MTTDIIAEANRNAAKITRLGLQRDRMVERLSKQHRAEWSKVRDRIWSLERKQRDLERAHERRVQRVDERKDKAVEKLSAAVQRHKRIIRLMDVRDKAVSLSFSVEPYRNEEAPTKVMTILSDDYVQLEAWIVPQQKPKNKYAIVLLGCSLFNEHIVKYPYSYGVRCNHTGAGIREVLREAPTKEELLSWLTKEKALSHFPLAEHEAAVKEYEWVKEHCTTKEWRVEKLLADKHYYEHGYSHGTETPEYKAVLKELKKLTGKEPKRESR